MSDRETPAKRLTLARIRAGYADPKDFYTINRIPQSTYSLHESGKRGLGPKTAEKYGRLLHCSAAWLLYGEGDEPSAHPEAARGLPAEEAADLTRRHEEEASFLLLYDRLFALTKENDQETAAEFGVIFRNFGYEQGPRGVVQLAFRFWIEIASEDNNLSLSERALKKIADFDNTLGSVKQMLRQIARLAGRDTPTKQ